MYNSGFARNNDILSQYYKKIYKKKLLKSSVTFSVALFFLSY